MRPEFVWAETVLSMLDEARAQHQRVLVADMRRRLEAAFNALPTTGLSGAEERTALRCIALH